MAEMAETGGWAGFPGGGWGAGAAGLGGLADLYSWFDNYQRQQAIRKIYDILANPQKLANYVNKYYQPMSAAANTAVQRDLGSNWATMTGGAPGGAMNQFVADALAKIETQRYQSAADQAIRALGGASATGQGLPQSAGGSLQGIMQLLQKIKGSQPIPPTQTGISSVPGYGDYRAGEWDRSPYSVPVPQETSPVYGAMAGP